LAKDADGYLEVSKIQKGRKFDHCAACYQARAVRNGGVGEGRKEQKEEGCRRELAQRRAGILPKKQIPAFRDLAERFLHTIKVERRSNTHRNYLSCVRNLEPAFGRKYLDEITPEMIRNFKETRIEQQLSPATINRDLSCLRQILGIAVKEELIQRSPFFGGRVEFLHEKGRERTLSFEEERKYLKAAAPVLRDVGTIMVEMGCGPVKSFNFAARMCTSRRPHRMRM
jgi:hypothetical protein